MAANSSQPVKFPLTTNLISLALTALIAVGGAAVTVYTAQATNTAKTEATEKRVDKLEQKTVTREELEAEFRAMRQQLQDIKEELRELRSDLKRSK